MTPARLGIPRAAPVAGHRRLGRLLRSLRLWHARARQRRRLARLGDHLLDDIGVSRDEALREAGKAFWRD